MKEDNSDLFFYTKYHLTQKFLHEIMLLLEYLPILVISLASPSLIYQYHHYAIHQSPFDNYYLFTIQLMIDITYHITTTVIVVSIIVFFLSLLGYYLIPKLFNATVNMTNWKVTFLNKLCSFYYDLFLLRTANFYIIFLYLSLFVYSLNKASAGLSSYYFVAFVFFCLILWYIAIAYKHIATHCVILHLENKTLSNQVLNYPYDWCFSMKHDSVMLGLKIICGIENVYFNSHITSSYRFVIVTLNALIVLYIGIYFLYLAYNTVIVIRLDWFMFNRVYVFMRIGIVLFIWFSIIFRLIFLSASSSNVLILSLTLMSLVWSIIFILLLWRVIIQGNLYNGKITLNKMLFALCVTTRSKLFRVDHYRLINSFELNYSILLKHKTSRQRQNLYSFQSPLVLIFMIYNLCKETKANQNKDKGKGCDSNGINNKGSDNENKAQYNSNLISYIYCDIVQLLYYSIKGKSLQYFCFYNTIISKYASKHKSILSNVHLIVRTFLTKSNESAETISVLSALFKGDKLHHIIDTTLATMKNVILSPKEMMKPMLFYDLSIDISKLKSFARTIVNNVELNDNKNTNDISTRNLIQVNNYCLLIHRYLIETLTNESLFIDSRIDFDFLKEFLSFHFLNDKTLLLSTPLEMLSLNENSSSLGNIIKCGNEMIRYKGQSVTQIFPAKFRKEGIRLFSLKLLQYVCDDSIKFQDISQISTSKSNTPFEFVINSNPNSKPNANDYTVSCSYVDLFIYAFKIVPTIINNELIINGIYSSNEKVIMIFKEEPDCELLLYSFSPSVKNLLIISPNLVEFLNSQNIVITFSEVFYKSSEKNTVVNSDNKHKDYECQFSYQIFLNHLLTMPHFDNLMQLYSNKNTTIDLKEKIIKAKETKYKIITLQLFYLFTITEKHKYLVYSIVASKALKSIRKTINTNKDFDNDSTDDIFQLHQTTMTIGNSATESTSISTSEMLKKRRPFGKFSLKISKTFVKFSNIILLFLFFIIFVCIIFLIIQIIQSQALYKVNTLYYQFKTLQIFFSNSFLNVFSNICIATKDGSECSNAYHDYSYTIQQLLHLPSKYSTRDYVVNAIGFLIENLQALYNSYNDNVHSYGDKSLIDILLTKMNYIMIRQTDDDIYEEVIQITVEEGLQKFINSLAILNLAKGNFDDPQYTVAIISVKSLKVDFSNVQVKKLNEVQKEIYKICINYINYSSGFANGEVKLIDLYDNSEKVKKIILYIYIVLIVLLHLILAFLCRWILIIVQKLLTSIIAEIIEELNKKEVNVYLVAKVDILSVLNKLYIKNPNSLFLHLDAARKDFIKSNEFFKSKKEHRLSVANANSFSTSTSNNAHSLSFEKQLQIIKGKSLVKQSEMEDLLLSIIIKIYSLFIIFFSCVIVFNVFLIHSFSDVMLINNYVLAHIGLESQLYNNIAFVQIMTLINLTQADLAQELGLEIPSDGILNMKIRQGTKFKDQIFNQEQSYPAMFPPISSYFNYTCNEIYKTINDNATISVGEFLGVDYLYYQIRVCEHFNITNVDNFKHLYNEHNFRSQMLQDYLKTYTYDELFNFNEQFDFFDVFTLTILILKPLKSYINEKILYKKIDNAFKQFIYVISGYLAFNIIADVVIFLILKFVVLGRINEIHLNFLSLNKCFTVTKSMLNQ